MIGETAECSLPQAVSTAELNAENAGDTTPVCYGFAGRNWRMIYFGEFFEEDRQSEKEII